MILFDNTEVAFRNSSDGDLRRAYWLFRMIGSPGLVKFGKWMTNFALSVRLPLRWIIKPTIFRQFCGGESIQESLKASKKLAAAKEKQSARSQRRKEMQDKVQKPDLFCLWSVLCGISSLLVS